MEKWEVVHIPDEPPVDPTQQPTVDVFAAVIEPNFANTIVRRLNQIAPLESLRHVKRIQKKSLQGKTQLSVILCLADEDGSQSNIMPQDIQELMNSYQLSAFTTKVCKFAASSKEEWEEQCKIWPTSYHPPTYNIEGITGFGEEELQSVFGFMRFTIELAKSSDGLIVNAGVIVDPSVKQIIASACDQVCSCYASTKGHDVASYSEQPEAISSNGVADHATLPSNGSPDETKRPYTGVSCLYPWQWAQQKRHSASCCWHPLRHAVLVAIESSAARDRQLFPGLEQNGDKSSGVNLQSSPNASPVKRQKTDLTTVENGAKSDALTEGIPKSDRPYLCTGYDMYVVWEPCIMCGMALVHQRVRRIFYAFPNQYAGALGSVHRLQGEKSLNHHYAVFRVILPEEILHIDETIGAGIAENTK